MLADMFQKDFSSHLSPEHKATARALQIMAYDHLYWYIYYLNIIQLIVFIDNRVRVFIGLAFCGNGSTPKGLTIRQVQANFASIFTIQLIRMKMKDLAHKQGMGRHRQKEVIEMGMKDLRSFSRYLG